jgi:hypothetical protein
MAEFITKLKSALSWAVAFVRKYKCGLLISTLLIVLFVVLFVYAVDNPPYNAPKFFSWKISYSAPLGKEVSLKIGRALVVESENLEIKFLGVISDYRCPKGVVCVWAGQVIVMVDVWKAGENLGEFELIDTNGGGLSPTQVDNYEIFLLKVKPYREVNKIINTKDYIITIKVDKVK